MKPVQPSDGLQGMNTCPSVFEVSHKVKGSLSIALPGQALISENIIEIQLTRQDNTLLKLVSHWDESNLRLFRD